MSKRSRSPKTSGRYSKKTAPFKKSAAQALFFLSAILWLLYAVYIILDMSAVKNSAFSVAAVGFFIAANAGAMLAAGILITRTQKWVYYFTLGITALNMVLTLTNLSDLFFVTAFIFDLLIFWVLFSLRKERRLQ